MKCLSQFLIMGFTIAGEALLFAALCLKIVKVEHWTLIQPQLL